MTVTALTKSTNPDLPIHHMASCARSGETMILRTMSTHPDIHIPMNVERHDDVAGKALVDEIRNLGTTMISRDRLTNLGLETKASTILVKQGVWEHKAPFTGFVLVRNPASVYASLRAYDGPTGNSTSSRLRKAFGLKPKLPDPAKSMDRMARWSRDIDRDLANIVMMNEFDEAFCAFYVRRMAPLAKLGLPIIHYERFVRDPETELRKICDAIGVEFRRELLNAHEAFEPGTVGHGKNDLSKPISKDGINKYTEIIDHKHFHRIKALTFPAWSAFGYDMTYGNVSVG